GGAASRCRDGGRRHVRRVPRSPRRRQRGLRARSRGARAAERVEAIGAVHVTETRTRPSAVEFAEPEVVRGRGVSFTRPPDNALVSVLMDEAERRIPASGGARRSTKEIEFVLDGTLRRADGRPTVFADVRAFVSHSGAAAGAIEVRVGRSRSVLALAPRRELV